MGKLSARAAGKPSARALCLPLREDPDLADVIPPERRAAAVEECFAPCLRIPRGPWGADGVADGFAGGVGLLVLDGLLIRRVGVHRGFGAELLGEGDLLRPWQRDEQQSVLFGSTGWRALRPTRVAVIDSEAAERIARHPELVGALVGRALVRARNLAVNMAIVHHPRVDVRLHALLWHLADRFGRVRSDGVVMPLKLTHAVLADLVAARRPTVTSALSELAARGLVRSLSAGWLLCGGPPGELREIAPASERGASATSIASSDGNDGAPAKT